MAHALKTRRQHMLKKTAQELFTAQTQRAALAGVAILMVERDGGRVAGRQTRGAQRGLLHVGGQMSWRVQV